MSAACLALVLYVGYVTITFGLRAWLLYRRTGSTGYNGLSGPAGSPGWWGGIGFIIALLAGLAAPTLQILDLIEPVDALDHTVPRALGLVLALIGGALTFVAQQAMGQQWRVGVDGGEYTDLVTTGVFALVRNPFFTALLIVATGLALLTPSPLALAALAALLIAIELQVRAVEEPHLHATHGTAYEDYRGRVGRFLPGIGTVGSCARCRGRRSRRSRVGGRRRRWCPSRRAGPACRPAGSGHR